MNVVATFRQLKSKKWQARVSKDGKEFSIGTFRTKKEAEIEAAKVEERIYYGQSLSDRNMLFKELSHQWLYDHKFYDLKEPTFENYIGIVRNHIDPEFGNQRIIRIRRVDIKNWLNKQAKVKNKKGKPKFAHGSRVRQLSILKSILHYAVYDLEVLEKNPADKLKVPVQDRAKLEDEEEVKYYNLEELNQLLDFMKTYKHQRFKGYRLYYMLMYFLSQTGLRISEALAVRWTDINNGKLTVERQTSRNKKNEVELTSLKNSSSYRTIKLSDELLAELKGFKVTQNQMILKYPSFKKSSEGIVFQNFRGDYLTPSIVRECFRDYCEKADVSYKGTHVFRHTHAVLLLESGANIKYVSKRLGHKTIKTTADTYLDITEKIEEDELKKFASYTSQKN